jgi:peptide deformylase
VPEPLKIVTFPAKVLSRPARRITPQDGLDLHDLFERMKVCMRDNEGIGLAAPQVGLGIRFAVAHDSKGGKTYGLVNPQITWLSVEKKVGVEGCLSFPGVYGDIERSLAIHVKWQDVDFVEHEADFEGHFARVLQHEIDHLNGILMLDRAIDGLWEPAKEGEETEEEEAEHHGEAEAGPDTDATDEDDEEEDADPYRGLVIDPAYETKPEHEPVESRSA